MPRTRLTPALHDLIQTKRWGDLSSRQLAWPASDSVVPELTRSLLQQDLDDQALFFRALPRPLATEVFAHLGNTPISRDRLLSALTDPETQELLKTLSPDDRTAFLGELPGQAVQRLLNLLDPHDLDEARQLLGYSVTSVGRLMTPDYVAVEPDWRVSKVIEHIREQGRDSETIDVIYVCDAQWHLLDALPLRAFLLAEPTATVRDLMDDTFVELSTSDDREDALRVFERYDAVALPVVDSEGVLLGIVTVDDILDVAEQEFTEDFQKFAAMEPVATGYWQTSVWRFYRSRVGWLAALVLVSLLSSGVIAAFEETLSQLVVLSFFIPLLMGAGGNTGSQSATLTIRALSTGDLQPDEWLRVVRRELLIGLALGLSLGLLGLVLGVLQGGGLNGGGLEIGLVIFLTMTIMLCVTNLLGVVFPFVLTRLKLDPASASGPAVASISDTVGLLIYFSLARLILRI